MREGKIKDLCTVIAGQSPKGSSYNEEGKGVEFHQGKKAFGETVLEHSNVWTTEITKIAEDGDILMSVRAPVGPTNITNRKICIGRGLAAIRCSDKVLPQYVLYALRSIENEIVGKDGTGFNSINKKMIEDLPIPIMDKDEQLRIVSFLNSEFSKIDTLKANAERALQNAKDLFQATLKEVMTPKEGWVFRKLGEICISINGLWKGKKEPFVNVGVIRNANFTKDFTLDFTKIEYLDVEARQYTTRKLQKGDIIVEKSGGSDKQPVGRAIIFDEEEGEYSFSNFTSVLRIKDKEKFSYKFLYLYLLHIYMRGDTKGMQKATTGIHNLDYHRFLDINIPVIPLAEQHQIVSFIETESYRIGTIKTNAERIIQECQNLKQSLLKQVFE